MSASLVPLRMSRPLPPALTLTVVVVLTCPLLTVILTVEIPVRPERVVKVAVRVVSVLAAKVTLLFGSRLMLEEVRFRVRSVALVSTSVILRVVLALMLVRHVLWEPPTTSILGASLTGVTVMVTVATLLSALPSEAL